MVQLNDVCERIDYGFTASADFSIKEPRLLRITDIQDGAVDWSRVPGCEIRLEEEGGNRLAVGDIVVARTGATTGKSFLIKHTPRAVFASYLIRLRTSREVLPEYLFEFLQSKIYWAQIGRSVRGAAQGGVNATVLGGLRLSLPGLSEQQRIAEQLEKADRLRRKRRYALELSDTFLQSVFLQMFGDPLLNPMNWPTYRLRKLCTNFSDGPFGSNLKTSHYTSDGVRVIRLQNIGIGAFFDGDRAYISHSHFNSLRKHQCLPGDVLIGTLGDPNLRACLLPPGVPMGLNKADCIQARADNQKVDANYVCWLLNMPNAIFLTPGMVHGQTRSRISMGQLAELPVPVPPLPRQREFANVVYRSKQMRTQQREAGRQAEHLYQALLHNAFATDL